MRTLRPGELTHGVDPADYPDYTVHGQYPWSVLQSTSKTWQARKKWWRDLPCHETGGRDDGLLVSSASSERHRKISGGTSRFDPALAECLIEWYSPRGGLVVDPFAGGAVRGVVATTLGRRYIGVDLSQRQVDANRAVTSTPLWRVGDAADVLPTLEQADYILTCPPYHNVERYSADPRDLSVMSWDDHLHAVDAVVGECHRLLADDSFLTWVVGDLRGPSGSLRLLPERTALTLERAGFAPVNHQILVTSIGSRYRMLRRWWTSTRSCGRIHEHVLTVVKGDRRRAVAKILAAQSDNTEETR